jgi:hypothetical protein
MTIQSMTTALVAAPGLSDTGSIYYNGSGYNGIVLIMTFYN